MEEPSYNSNQLKVRNACEGCHRRKIKCIIGAEGGSCRACKSTSRNCFFLPKQKCGRVPKKGSEHRRISIATEDSRDPPVLFVGSDITNECYSLDTTNANRSYASLGPGYLTPTIQSEETNVFDQNMAFSYPEAADGVYPISSNHGMRMPLSSVSDKSASLALNKSCSSLQNLGWQLSPVQPPSEYKQHNKLLVSLLNECNQIQKQREDLAEARSSRDDRLSSSQSVESTARGIDSICNTILEVSKSNSSTSPMRAVDDPKLICATMTAIFTVLEICEVLAASQTTPLQGPDCTLIWKRLDLNLTQIRVALQRLMLVNCPFSDIFRQAIRKIKVLDNRVKSTIQDGYSDWEDV